MCFRRFLRILILLSGVLFALALQVSAQTVSSVAVGGSHTLFVKSDGTLWAMGDNTHGQLGDGSTVSRSYPVRVATGVASASGGGAHTLYVKTDGTLWAMGRNDRGQLGDGTTTDRNVPVQIASGVAAVSAGASHSMFRKTDGTLWATGANSGQLGDGTTTDRNVPVQVASGVTAVSAGGTHTLLVKTDGTLWATGSNSLGQLGDGSNFDRPMWEQVATGVVSVSAGPSHTMFIKTDGTLWATGANYYSQLGDGSNMSFRNTPVQVATGVASVAAGAYHTMFVRVGGALWAVGGNFDGQLGDGTTTDRKTFVQVTGGVAWVAAGNLFTVFVRTDGSLWATGGNESGELGEDLTTTSRSFPEQVAVNRFVVTSSGVTTFTEGNNVLSAPVAIDPALTLSAGRPTLASGTVALAGNIRSPEDLLGFVNDAATMGNIASTFDGSTGVLTLTSAGAAATVGQWQAALRAVTYTDLSESPNATTRTISFTVNDGTTTSSPATKSVAVVAVDDSPSDIALSTHSVSNTAGVYAAVGSLTSSDVDSTSFTYSLVSGAGDSDNAAFNISGSTLRATVANALAPGDYSVRIQTASPGGGTFAKAFKITVTADGRPRVASVAAGYQATMFVGVDGTLWGVGSNGSSQLGTPGLSAVATPVMVATEVASAVDGSTLFLKRDGTLWGMGYPPFNPVLSDASRDTTTPAPLLSGVAAVAVGGSSIMIVKTDGTLWTAGNNRYGQLGDGSTFDRYALQQIATGVASIAAGGSHAMFVKTDGTLWAMGANYYGQLGDGTTTARSTPVQVAAGVRSVAAGGDHTLLIKLDGTLWGMGSNGKGQLGDGSTTDRSVPVQIASGVASVTAGATHTLFIKVDGTLWSTGNNSDGELGDGTTINRSTPSQIATGVAVASSGSNFSEYVTTTGELWSTGSGYSGQLGDGILGARSTAIRVFQPLVSRVALSGGKALFTEGKNTSSIPVVVDPGLTLTASASNPVSATVGLVGLSNSAEHLGFTSDSRGATGNIQGTYDFGAAVLVLTSYGDTATTAQWQAALRSITYTNSSESPNTADRIVSFVIYDSSSETTGVFKNVAVQAVDDAPTNVSLYGNLVYETAGLNAIVGRLSSSDVDSTQFTYSLVDGSGATDNALFNISGDSLRANDAAALTVGNHSVRVQTADGSGGTYAQSFTIQVKSGNYTGVYFGTFNRSSGVWAMKINADNTGNFIAYLTDRKSALVTSVTVSTAGSITASGYEMAPTQPGTFPVSFQFGNVAISEGQVFGSMYSPFPDFTGAVDPAGTSGLGGFYMAAAINASGGATYAIIGPSGRALVVSATPAFVDSMEATIGADGQLAGVMTAGGTLALSINASTGIVTASVTPAGKTQVVPFAGLAEGAVSTTRLVNISARAYCGTGNQVTIGGFVIADGATKRVLIRAVGPSLSAQGVSAAEVLADPTVEVHDAIHGNSIVATNDNWGDNANVAEINRAAASVGATALLGSDTQSSALLLDLAPGVYSFVVGGRSAASGIVLLEVYDADSSATGSKFVNISTRAYATTGNGVAIGGFVVRGNAPKRLLLRAVGPTLTTQGLGAAEVLADPQIELHDALNGNAIIATNDDWTTNANALAIMTTGARIGATPFDLLDTRSAALLITLQPGVYSFVASGKSAAPSGIVLVEVYDAD